MLPRDTDVEVLILQDCKSLTFESICPVCTTSAVLRHLTRQAVSAPGQSGMVSLLVYNVLFLPVRAVQNKALNICHRNTCNSQSGESSWIPFACCFPVHHKKLLWKQPTTLLSPRLESNPIWEDLPCYLAKRQNSNGIISYDMLMPASDLNFSFLVFFLTSDFPSSSEILV